jgi:hypothetical protein
MSDPIADARIPLDSIRSACSVIDPIKPNPLKECHIMSNTVMIRLLSKSRDAAAELFVDIDEMVWSLRNKEQEPAYKAMFEYLPEDNWMARTFEPDEDGSKFCGVVRDDPSCYKLKGLNPENVQCGASGAVIGEDGGKIKVYDGHPSDYTWECIDTSMRTA